jgi:ABC-type oligopeptide transport system ATPase subunit
MDRGKIVEMGAAEEIVRAPKHDPTRRLLAAAATSGATTPWLQVV